MIHRKFGAGGGRRAVAFPVLAAFVASTVGAGCGATEHPGIKEGVSPYEKSKASRNAYKDEILVKSKGRRPGR